MGVMPAMEGHSQYYLLSERTQGEQSLQSRSGWREKMNWIRTTSLLFAGMMMASILWTLGLCLHPEFSPIHSQTGLRAIPSSTPTRHCGSTPNEARINGCQFQLWSYSWVPSECFNHDLQTSFLDKVISSEGWSYYSSPRGSEADIVDTGIVMGGGRDNLFTTWGQHYWHCVYYQRKFFSIMLGNEGLRLDMMTTRDKDEHHALSCQRWIADPKAYDWERVNVNLTLGYHSC